MSELFIVDVFAEQRYAGNQLAVVVCERFPEQARMQAIAAEMNFSETTFVLSSAESSGNYPVRIFTPSEELPFAGHPVIGTGAVVRNEVLSGKAEKLTLATGLGPVALEFEADALADLRVWMQPGLPELGANLPREELAPLLGLGMQDFHATHLPVEVTLGIGFVLVPLSGGDALGRATFSLDHWHALQAKGTQAMGVFLFADETSKAENHWAARAFFEASGAREDPATGSANTCFARWIAAHTAIPATGLHLRVEQGVQMGRPSVIHLSLNQSAGPGELNAETIRVGGGVILVARGQLT